MTMALGNGRPLFVIATDLLFEAAGSIAGLAFVRAFGLLGIIVLALLVQRMLARGFGAPPWFSACVAFLVAMLPAVRISAVWAQTSIHSWALVLSIFTSLLLTRASTSSELSRGQRIRRYFLAATLYISAFLIYQPAAMALWSGLAAWLSFCRPRLEAARRQFLTHLILFGVGTVIALGAAYLCLLLTDVEPSLRARPLNSLDDLAPKAWWFVTRYLATAARPFLVDSPSPIEALLTAVPILLIVTIGLWLMTAGALFERATHFLLLSLIVPLSVAPLLVISESQIEFRLLPAISMTLIFYLAASLRDLFKRAMTRVRVPKPPPMPSIVLVVAMVALAGFATKWDIEGTWTVPGEIKETFLRGRIDQLDPRTQSVAVILPSPPFGTGSAWGAHDRLGDYTVTTDLSVPWVPRPNVRLILLEEGRRTLPVYLFTNPAEVPGPAADVAVIDTRQLVPILAP
jgi:hypothetical protein